MKKINEKELKTILEGINNRTVELSVKGIVTIEMIMQKVECEYNQRSGILNMYDRSGKSKFSVETSMAYMILESNDRKHIEIKVDNEPEIILKIV